jgi:outer membrane cobalamin receptor
MKVQFYVIIVFLIFCFIKLSAKNIDPTQPGTKVTISGTVRDKSNGEVQIGATVYIRELKNGAITNAYGFYSLNLKPGIYNLVFSYMGYQSIERKIELNKELTVNIELERTEKILDEVVVTANRAAESIRKPEMSVNKLDAKTIQRIPALMGEIDIIKVIQMLPGVISTSEGSSGFSVRGGGADQNQIILDEATVYNASHLMGFFSVFNNDAIKDVKLYKGDIPASYGGRLSSVLDVRMKDGNTKKFSGEGGVGLLSSRLTLEGPIGKGNDAYIVSGRRTYADLFLPLSSNKEIHNNKLYFYDLNVKVNTTLNENNQLFISGYMGRDVFKNKFALMTLGNQTFTLRWNHLFSKKIFANFSLIGSRYDYQLGTPDGQTSSFNWTSQLQDYSFKADFSWYLNPENTIKFGAISTYHYIDPGQAEGRGTQSLFSKFVVPANNALEHAFFVSDELKIVDKLILKYGLRVSVFQNVGKATVYQFNAVHDAIDSVTYASGKVFKTQAGVEPRLGLTYNISGTSAVKASYSRTMQYMQLAQNSAAGTPLDIWFPASQNIKPQICDQYAIGYFHNFRDNSIEFSVEGYYKQMQNTIDFKDHAQLLLNAQLEGEERVGKSTSFGAEVLIRKNDGRLNGWISYTYSNARRTIKEINNGNAYKAPYDKPNNFAIVVNYELSKRTYIAANWIYASGTPMTVPTGRAMIGNDLIPVYLERNGYRIPDYHRLDVSFAIKGKEKPIKKWKHEWVFSIYNVYGQKNTWALNFVQDKADPNHTYAEKTYLFTYIPSVTFNFKF